MLYKSLYLSSFKFLIFKSQVAVTEFNQLQCYFVLFQINEQKNGSKDMTQSIVLSVMSKCVIQWNFL